VSTADYELRYLKAGTDLLEKYILAPDLYWPIGLRAGPGLPPYPNLTLSGILLMNQKIHARKLPEAQQTELAGLGDRMEQVKAHWRVAWSKKAANEFHSRLTLWGNFLDDYRDDPRSNVDRYDYEVSRRAQLTLLMPEAEQIPAVEEELLNGLDKFLLSIFISGEFIWEPELISGFPRDVYWYLYGKPSREALS
jgi:hypothetical protein